MDSLRISTSDEVVMSGPDRTMIDAVVASCGDRAVVVLDSDGHPASPFLQATRLDGGVWRVEAWQVGATGREGERYWTLVDDAAALSSLFWSWASGTDEWQQRRWHAAMPNPLAAAG